jgi:tetratricopeptide (TPR) repeat protein
LTELEDRGLIGWDREANRYDAHPIVRGVALQLTNAKDQRSIYTALEAHFESMATPAWQKVETIADLTPAIERYHILIGLRRYDNACELFYDRLSDATLYRLAAHRESIECLECLFRDGLENLPMLISPEDQAWVLNRLANSYFMTGQPGRAAPLYRRANGIYEQLKGGLQNILVILGRPLFEIGALRETNGTLRQALILNRDLDDRFQEGVTLSELGRLFGVLGECRLGRIAILRGIRLFQSTESFQGEGIATAHLAEQSLWVGETSMGLTWAERAWELAKHNAFERDFIRAAIWQGRAALSLGDLAAADERLYHALTRARAVRLVGLELASLITLAELELRRGHNTEARACLNDVWEAAERGPYQLLQADACNVLTAIALAENDQPAAIDAATKVYKAAWCDGPPYAYHWGLQKAKAHLAVLGAPEPDMPPFDESKFEPLPEVEINPKDEYWVDPDKLD